MRSIVEQRTWQVSESPFNPCKLSHLETIFTVGNGYMGLRGTFEEGYEGELVSTLAHGVYNHLEGELVPDLVNLPNPLAMTVQVDDVPFAMQGSGRIMGYRRTLDLEKAVLTREVLWTNNKGTIVKLTFERFASLEHDHLLVQRLTVRALMGSPEIKVSSALDSGVRNYEGGYHWLTMELGSKDGELFAVGKTTQSNYEVAVISQHVASPQPRMHTAMDTNKPTAVFSVDLAQDQVFELVKYTAIHSNRDARDPRQAARATLDIATQQGYDSLFANHCAEWAKYWHNSDIQIDGDEVAQRAIRFCTYHVLIAAPRNDETVSIGAKTLSGPGYKGHVFWDTELFMVPMLTVTQPKLARNLLMYRYHNLAGARHKAANNGYEGAMFPWESTDTGEETTPQWTNPLPDGTRIRIWTGDTEQHVSTDIAYAVMQYWHWTRDEAFFVDHGAEIVLDTAVFWGSRAEYIAERDRYELSMQIGPDEYHENVNNSAFTNRMVQWHLQTALEVFDWLKTNHPSQAEALFSHLKIDEARLDKWRDIIAKMYIPRDPQTGVLEQFDGFFKLKPMDITHWQPRVVNMDAILGHSVTQSVGVIKQADIVMLMALLGEAFGTVEERQANWDYYLPVVDHGSSLSPSIHAWVGSRLGLSEKAYELFMYSANIDLEDIKGNVRDGIHAAASGGVWQAAVFGFAGVTLDTAGSLNIVPQLPSHWRKVSFRLWIGGEQKTITLTNS